MIRASFILILALSVLGGGGCATEPTPQDPVVAAEARAIEFLKREVPAWSRDNGCFSCHNNGDAARALYAASRKGYQFSPGILEDTTDWISHPERWHHNKGDPGFSDQNLADVQFAASLAAAVESRTVNDDQAMKAAALKVARAQSEDGSWPIDVANAAGSPATYGATLATYMAWDSLRRISSPAISAARLKAEEKLRAIKPDSVPNAAVRLLFLAKSHESPSPILADTLSPSDGEKDGVRSISEHPQIPASENSASETSALRSSLAFLRRAQTSDGGWGPFADSPPEAFDTALALLSLKAFRKEAGVPEMIRRGREFLRATQLPDGSWPATTRPSGGQSYAQQMSTTGWATLALLATR